ncbi:MAG: hypothetical protein M1819_004855 [Sarea resinae]|nr:MAG: hypothetical protein M1819_004855 [Sarea resinae]
MNAPYLFHSSTDSGVTLNRFSQDMSLIDSQLPAAFQQTSVAVAVAIGGGILIAAGSKFMAVTIPFCLLILYVLQKFYLRLSRQVSRKIMRVSKLHCLSSKSPLFTHFTDTNHGLHTIRAFGWQTRHVERCLELLDRSQQPAYLLLCIQRWLGLALDLLIMGLAVVLVSLVVGLSGSTSGSSIGVALINILGFNQTLATAITSYTALETSIGAIVRTKNFVAETTPESNPPPSPWRTSSSDWPSRGEIELRDVNVAYSPTEPLVLRDFNLVVPAGHKVAICGRSGCGKSSLVLLLARLLDCSSAGVVSIDGVPIGERTRETVRSALTILPQDLVVIPGTVRENVDPSGTRSDGEIVAALCNVGLAHVASSEQALNMAVEKVPLSRGQRQLFALASASLRESKVVILDEATSHLDAESEQVVKDLVLGKWRHSTVLAVVHRLAAVVDYYDMVAVIDAGRVVEYGDPRELMAQEGSWFGALWNA